MAVAAPPPAIARERPRPRIDARILAWLRGLPTWASMGALLVVLMGVSAYFRTRFIGGQFWMDEALSVGIASHPLTAIPGVLRHDGSPPLYYMLLHVWMSAFGASESATHGLSVLFGLLTIPAGMWAGWSLFGKRAGAMAAILFSFNAYLTAYAQETRMYELMALLGLLATGAFVHAFIYRRRAYLIMFAVCQALMLYTHVWGVFFGAGTFLALIPIYWATEDRRGLVRDAVLAFGGAAILFAPWLPNFIWQIRHTAAPWDTSPRLGAPIQVSRNLLGGDRVTVALLIGTAVGLAELATVRLRRTRDAAVAVTLIAIPVLTLLLAWIASQFSPAWVARYFAPILGAILLLAAFGCSRAGILGIVVILATMVFLANPAAVAPAYKSDMRDIGGEMTPLLHPGDLAIEGQPEQVPLMWYYLPSGLRYANTIGPVSDPRYMDWVNALARLRDANPQATLDRLLASLKPGQQVLFVRPLTEGTASWNSSWTQLVRRRCAQWGATLAADRQLREVRWAPHLYRHAYTVGNSAVLYEKVS